MSDSRRERPFLVHHTTILLYNIGELIQYLEREEIAAAPNTLEVEFAEFTRFFDERELETLDIWGKGTRRCIHVEQSPGAPLERIGDLQPEPNIIIRFL